MRLVVGQCNGATVGCDDRAAKSQSQPKAAAAVRDSIFPGEEHLKHFFFCSIRDAGAVIAHLNYGIFSLRRSGKDDMRPCGRVFDGIIHQID